MYGGNSFFLFFILFVPFSLSCEVNMRSSGQERARELEAAIAVRKQELDELKEQRHQLESQLITASASGEDLLGCYPVYEYCGRRPRRSLKDVPIEQVGNVTIQFEAAMKAIEHQNSQDDLMIAELKKSIRQQEYAEKLWREKKNELAKKTGVDLAFSSAARRTELMNLQGYRPDASPEEVEARKRILRKEMAAGRLIRFLKGKTIETAHRQMEERNEMVNAIDQLYNDIRVMDRDLEEQNRQIEELRMDEEDVIKVLDDRDATEARNQLLIEQVQLLVQSVREEKLDVLLTKCEPQTRVLKAQEYRLNQLEKRQRMTEECLKSNCSIKDVSAIVEAKWESLPPDALVVEDRHMDVEAILPADEKIHPALFNLFLREKEKLAQGICKFNVLVAEKESALASQVCKLEALSRACNQSIQELDDTANGAAFEEEGQRCQALEWAKQQRALYSDLLYEKNKLTDQ